MHCCPFRNKKPKIADYNIVPDTLESLLNYASFFGISCSFTNIIKQESFDEIDRECKTCLDEIIKKIEYEYTIIL